MVRSTSFNNQKTGIGWVGRNGNSRGAKEVKALNVIVIIRIPCIGKNVITAPVDGNAKERLLHCGDITGVQIQRATK